MSGQPPRRGSSPGRDYWDEDEWGGAGGPRRPDRRQEPRRSSRQQRSQNPYDEADEMPSRGGRPRGGQRADRTAHESSRDPYGDARDPYSPYAPADSYPRAGRSRDARGRGSPRDYDDQGSDAGRSYGGQQGAYGDAPDYQRSAQQVAQDWEQSGGRRARAGGDAWRRVGQQTSERMRAASVGLRDRSRRKFPLAILGILIVLVALVIGGVFAVPRLIQRFNPTATVQSLDDPYTPLPGPSPTPPAHFTAFTSTRSSYSLDYPTGWSVSSKTQTAQGQADFIDVFLQATQTANASFWVEQAAAAASVPDDQVIASEVRGAQQNGVTLTPQANVPQTASVGGAQWQRRDFTVTASGNTAHEVILACHHGGRSFVIVYISPTSTFNSDLSSFFSYTLASFRFLK